MSFGIDDPQEEFQAEILQELDSLRKQYAALQAAAEKVVLHCIGTGTGNYIVKAELMNALAALLK